jgi:hypothetical protein
MTAFGWRIKGHGVKICLPCDGRLVRSTPREGNFFRKRFTGVGGRRRLDA